MHQRKKNQNKQNFKTIKKTTVQQINYTQQLHIPTFATMELRQAGRSIELKKSSSKKPISRKSRCISVKQSGPQQPFNIKQLLKQIKSLKLIHSRQKSPRLSKSKQKNKKSTKKIVPKQSNSKSHTQLNLTAKLQQKLQKLKHQIQDEDQSQIPLMSTSQAFTQQQKKKLQYIVSGQNFDDINIRQLRRFCNNKQPRIRISLDYFKGNIYQLMARRIQRAWRRYRTHNLVQRYVNLLNQNFEQNNVSPQLSKNQQIIDNKNELMMISSQLYPQEMIQRKITYISNLQQQEQNQQQDQAQNNQQETSKLYHLKKQQLQKWSEIIQIINSNRTQNPQQTQKLLKKLMNKSEINRRNLQNKGDQLQQSGTEKQQINNTKPIATENFVQQINKQNEKNSQVQHKNSKKMQQKSSVSQDSMKQIQEQFNSKKYIEYLDSDMYPIANHHRSSLTTIGKKKQETLLQRLQDQNSVKRLLRSNKFLGSNGFLQMEQQIKSRLSYRSNSELSSLSQIDAQQLKSSRSRFHRRQIKILSSQIRKSISQKNIKYSSYQQHSQQKQEEQKQLQQQRQQKQEPSQTKTIQKQQIKILQLPQKARGVEQALQCIMKRQLDSDFQQFEIHHHDSQQSTQNEKAYLQQQFKKQIEELHRIRQQDSDSQQKYTNNQIESAPILSRSNNELNNLSVQNCDCNIQSQQDNSEGQKIQKGQAISQMLNNSLVIQFLVQVARYPESILKSFKSLALKKPKIKRAPNKGKKNGFPTNQAQIKNFIEQLCNFVLHQQPQVFKNLQKATGPSALQMLRYMHQSVQNDIYIQQQDDDPSIMILPNRVFESFWNKKVQSIKYQRQGLQQQRQKQRHQYLKGLNKIFLRSCFDCMNQCLDYQRNYGPFGKPFPWKRSHYFDHIKTLQQTKKSVKNSQKRLFEVSSTYCGIIIEKDEIASLGGNQDYINQVQQDRLSRMLAQDLVQGEQRWIFYDDEQTELLVQASNTIFHQLFEQLIMEIRYIEINRFSY